MVKTTKEMSLKETKFKEWAVDNVDIWQLRRSERTRETERSQQAIIEKLRKWYPEANEGSIPRVSVVIVIDRVIKCFSWPFAFHFFRDSVSLAIIIFY